MIPPLPEIRCFRQACRHEDGWTDHYGALQTAAAYAGFALPEHYRVDGLWQHGCFAPWEATSPEVLVFNAPGAAARPALVARADEAQLLTAAGYRQARAIGLPILYTAPTGAARIPGSLLVMPTHTLIGDRFPSRADFERYADEVSAVARAFDHVTVCVHPNCRRNGFWIPEFEARGFAIVTGAQTNDANALQRMRQLFETYETVTSNGWGSHIAYALAFGARVAVDGTCPAFHAQNLLQDLAWSVNQASLDQALAPETRRREAEFLAPLRRPPPRAEANVALGQWLIGAAHQLTPAAMREVLGTLIQPLEPLWQTVQRQRQAIRAQARLLARSGRRGEAVKLLLLTAQRATQLGDPRAMFETLRDVAVDLRPLDPAKARALDLQLRQLNPSPAGPAA